MAIVKEPKTILAIPHDNNVDYSVNQQYQSLVNEKKRDWFSKHAYYCLPLTIGNQYGFVVKAQHSFEAIWNGGPSKEDTTITFLEENKKYGQFINSHFGLGIITVQNNFILRTPEGVNLMTINPPNYFIDGLGYMTGVVETDNLRRDFTFNLKLTRPNHIVKINKGDWIGCFIPIPRYFVDSFQLLDADERITYDEISEEQLVSKKFGEERNGPDKTKSHESGRRYYFGEDIYGNKFTDHQIKVTGPKKSS